MSTSKRQKRKTRRIKRRRKITDKIIDFIGDTPAGNILKKGVDKQRKRRRTSNGYMVR